MLNKKLALEIINLATSTGADFAEIYYEESFNSVIKIENQNVDVYNEGMTQGVGLRLLKGIKSVYGSTSDISRSSLIELATKLSESFNEPRNINKINDFETIKAKKSKNKYTPLTDIKIEQIIETCKHLSKIISDYSPKIIRVNVAFALRKTTVGIFNSNGKFYKNNREQGRFFMDSFAKDGDKVQTNFDGPGSISGWEYFFKDLKIEEIAKSHARKVILMLEAKECPSGRFPVVIGNGWGGVIFHEACGHQLEATAVSKGLSVFADKLGEQIASPLVTAYDDGTIENAWGSIDLDDEGSLPQKNLLIENGICKGFLVDNFTGRRMNAQTTGSSRRQNYKFEPTSRMTNTYIAPGKSTKKEIIKATKLGLYAVSFSGGSVDPSTGDFNFSCTEAYIIKDGKICDPVRGATLIGNAKEILMNIDMVGDDLDLGQGMCGSISGNIPVTVGQPTIRVKEIVVGGRGGNIDEF